MSWFTPRHTVTLVRPGPDVLDSYNEPVPGPDIETPVQVSAVWIGASTDESGTYVQRVEVDASLIAESGMFSESDRVRLPESDDLFQVVGRPKNWDRTPWAFSPGNEVVELKAVTG